MKERDEELALFLEMRRREKENEKSNLLLLENSDELEFSNLGMFCFSSSLFCYFVVINDGILCFSIQNLIMRTL
jgi:hypothetical protein